MTRQSFLNSIGLLGLLMMLTGCGASEPVGVPHVHNPDAEVTLCGLCGEVKGNEKCCKEGSETCAICGLHKGAPLCCSTAISGRRDILLCRKCGELGFSERCCKEGAAVCPKCSLHKGSPGCCRIEPVAKDTSGGEFEHAHEAGEPGHG